MIMTISNLSSQGVIWEKRGHSKLLSLFTTRRMLALFFSVPVGGQVLKGSSFEVKWRPKLSLPEQDFILYQFITEAHHEKNTNHPQEHWISTRSSIQKDGGLQGLLHHVQPADRDHRGGRDLDHQEYKDIQHQHHTCSPATQQLQRRAEVQGNYFNNLRESFFWANFYQMIWQDGQGEIDFDRLADL